jgi:hypothetical protein
MKILIGIFLLTINLFSQIQKYPLPNEIKRIGKNDFLENFINYEKNVQYSVSDSTIIDPTLLDTSNYSGKYNLMGVFDLFNPGFDGKLTLGDFNGDKNTEIYCTQYVPYIYFTPAKIFEFDSDINLNLVYSYPDSQTYALASYDIDGDGGNEIIINTYASRGIYVYTKPNQNSYPIELKFFYSIGPEYQVDNHTFCDADDDGLTDYIFTAPTGKAWLYIYEYDSLQNNFVEKYSGDKPSTGFIVYDFDLDGKNEIIGAGGYGDIAILECTGDNKYELSFELDTELYNAYQIFYTEDIDNNGYPEFWIGGNDFVNDSFKFICFENARDNYYKRVTSISIKYLGAYPYGYVTARDFSNDGTEEIFIVFNEFMFILEFAGKPNNHNYNVIYYGIVKPENPFIYMDNVTVYDIFNRGQQEIIVSLLEGTQTNYFSRTYIYTNGLPTDVKNDLIISDNYFLYQNFPNPFNPKTKIKYSIPSSNIVQVKLYDIMGREIKTLLNEFKQAGTYEFEFDAINLPSGVYFYRMISGDYSETKKMILLR